MKKAILTLVILAISDPDVSNAQLIKNYGVKLAITSASQTFDYSNPPVPDFGPKTVRRTGFNIGGFVEWLNVPFFSAVSQIEYAQRGVGEEFVVTGPQSPTPIGRKIEYRRIDYLSVPILAKVRVPIGIASPYLLIGPRIDFVLGYQENQPNFNSIYKDFKKTMVGGSIGFGVESNSVLPVGLSAEFRYNTDFSDSFDNGFLKVRNNAFDVWLGVAL